MRIEPRHGRTSNIATRHPPILKTGGESLAIHGGPPAFAEPVHVGRPNIPDRAVLLQRINGILDRAWLTNNGQEVQLFEQAVAAVAGVRHCISTSNGTSALSVLARALDLHGEVIMPAMTFIATAHAFEWQGITPVFADIDPDTCCIDPRCIERLITTRTTAIVGVHLWGQPCPVGALQEIADRHRLPLIFDSSHAFGCSHDGRAVGSFGIAETFSFHATKFINAAEGGAIVTNNDDLARRARLIRNFGFAGTDDVELLGTNAKLNELAAAMGRTSLESMDTIVARNRSVYQAYAAQLSDIPGIRLQRFPANERNNYQYIVLRLCPHQACLTRDELLAALQAENVLARRYFYPGCHRSPPYGSMDAPATPLPHTDRIADEALCLPGGSAVNEDEAAAVCQIVRLCVGRGASSRCA